MAAIVARHAGARYIVASDLSSYRLEMARRIGVIPRALDVHTESIATIVGSSGCKRASTSASRCREAQRRP